MHMKSFLVTAALGVAAIASAGSVLEAAAPSATTVSGPVVHDNLAVYFVHGRSAGGPVPLTLAEALEKGKVRVTETGDVNELSIENIGDNEVFVHSGDIVKGGKQDRTLSLSMVVPPRSGPVPIAAFCVEHGRWSERSGEDVTKFEAAPTMVPMREAKLMLKKSAATPDSADASASTGDTQQGIWNSVASIQDMLGASVGAPVKSEASESSLALALEAGKLKDALDGYIANLQKAGTEGDDIIGYVFAINGQINSGDVYPSNGLFRKLWPKLIEASATEAISLKKEGASPAAPDVAVVEAFLKTAEAAPPKPAPLAAGLAVDTRDGATTVYSETTRADGSFIHRSYLVK